MKNYVLLLNGKSVNFLVNEKSGSKEKLVSLDDIENWLKDYSESGVYKIDDVNYSLMELMDILLVEEVDLFNGYLIEMGDDYCNLKILEV